MPMLAADRRPLGATNLSVTALSLGCGPLGHMFELVADDQAIATVDAAYAAGLRYFDTAPLYGVGTSERRAGAALAARPRDSFVLSTKVGVLLEPADEPPSPGLPSLQVRRDYSADGVRRSIDASLERLGLDRVDVVHVHDPDNFMDDALDGAFPALRALRDDGVIGAVSAGMNHAAPLARFVREAGVDSVLLAGRYTLLDQTALAELLPLCAEHHVGYIAAGVINSGILADPKDDAPFFYTPASPELLAKARSMQAVCRRHGVELLDAALQFPAGHPAVSTVLIGSRSPAEIQADVTAFERAIPSAMWDELRAEGLLGAEVPTPG
ncbi:MAG TPA: aldo/keto reductase [Acidimicrobiia bacterium]|nr:aldo/keto reductase [Acidimicrobiia bacterium]